MTTMTSTAAAVIGGVDTHADVHVAAACDQVGSVLGTQAFPTTTAGYRQLLGWLRGFGDLTVVGIEGTGSYGVGLTRFLLEAGVDLREVLRPNRQVRRRNGKTDVVDAIAAARAVLSGEASARPKSHDGAVEALRALKIVHRSANKSRTQALNQMRDLITTAPDGLRTELRGLRRRQRIAVCAAFRPGDRDDLVTITKLTLRTLARRFADLDEELAVLNARRRRITHALAPRLVAAHGIGPETAAGLLLAAGDNPDRLGSERSWAALLASNPIEASSGKTKRHRLNRGGDRHCNSALWRIVVVRMATDPRTKAYVERRTKEGLSTAEIIRCLKRYVARETLGLLPENSSFDSRSITYSVVRRCQGYGSKAPNCASIARSSRTTQCSASFPCLTR
jgi:transposase